MKPSDIVEQGIAQVLEGRRIFSELTVNENLRLGGHTASKDIKENTDRIYDLFPLLAPRAKDVAGYLREALHRTRGEGARRAGGSRRRPAASGRIKGRARPRRAARPAGRRSRGRPRGRGGPESEGRGPREDAAAPRRGSRSRGRRARIARVRRFAFARVLRDARRARSHRARPGARRHLRGAAAPARRRRGGQVVSAPLTPSTRALFTFCPSYGVSTFLLIKIVTRIKFS